MHAYSTTKARLFNLAIGSISRKLLSEHVPSVRAARAVAAPAGNVSWALGTLLLRGLAVGGNVEQR